MRHPRWLINRAASKLAPRRLRGYFLGNPWNIYAGRVAKRRGPRSILLFPDGSPRLASEGGRDVGKSEESIRVTRRLRGVVSVAAAMIYAIVAAEIARAVWHAIYTARSIGPAARDIIRLGLPEIHTVHEDVINRLRGEFPFLDLEHDARSINRLPLIVIS